MSVKSLLQIILFLLIILIIGGIYYIYFFSISSNNKINLNTDIELNQKETTKNEVLYTDERTDEIQIIENEKRKDKINSIIGYSGKIIDTEHLSKNIVSRPKVILMHGDKDEIVPINFFLEAKEFFIKNNYPVELKSFENCEHRIPQEGSSLGLEFIKKNLY